jgi:hypothetical protein
MVSQKQTSSLPIRVNRDTPAPALQPFTDYFKGFERVEAVRKVFGDKTDEVLAGLKIGFIANRRMYMGIRDEDGNLAVGTYHLKHSTTRVLYLDIVHELFHIGQWLEDKEWFTKEHEKFMGNFELYYVSPLEVPAYAHTVREAERLGMTPEEITEYLKMLPTPPKVWDSFLRKMGHLKGPSTPRSSVPHERLQVKINRNPKLVLLPFTDYFQGMEDAPPVRALFGKDAKKMLKKLRVEFLESPFGSIFPSEEDGHLVVNSEFIKEADVESIYLDLILSICFVAGMPGSSAPGSEETEFGESPLVLKSYKAMVKEARRIGTPDERIMERLQMPRFMMSEQGFKRFVQAIGVKQKRR